MLAKLEKKISEFKKKQDPRYVAVFMFAVFGAVVLIAMNFANVYGREKQENSDSNNRAMYEIITSVNNIDVLVAKVRITMSNEYNIVTLSEITKEASLAKENLAALPVSQNSMGNVSKFLSQVIGYSETLIKRLAKDEKLTKVDYENLQKINEQSNNLNEVLKQIYASLTEWRIKWDEVEKVASEKLNEENSEINLNGIEKVTDSLAEYERLISDGAFSNHLETSIPKSLMGKEVTVEQATKKVRECVENGITHEIEEVVYNGETNGRVDVYNFEVKLKDVKYTVDVDITKKDGKLLLMMLDRPVLKQNIDIEEAKKIGDKYLTSLGLKDFDPTYYLTTDNMTTINYAATQDGVLLYPDLIKVKIAMDTGEVCSVECTGYIFNHVQRKNIVPSISETKAKESLSPDIELESTRLAIIPTNSNNEVLTYEFKGKIDNNTFLIYINANTGEEENILILLETKGGILTI